MYKPMYVLCLGLLILATSCKQDQKPETTETYTGLTATYTERPISIDGLIDNAWKDTPWRPIDQVWEGYGLTPQDFKGEYKVKYDKNYLYILANIIDEKLYDQEEDGLLNYWDDDCLEVFVDEDRSGGLHQYNHNAFAYHISLDRKITDMGIDSLPHYYNDHVKSARKSSGMRHIWEASIKIYDDSYTDGGKNTPVNLGSGKKMGFAIAYCDNDGSKERENFIGSTVIEGKDKDRAWIDAGLFEELRLK